MEKREHSYTIGGNGKQYGGSSKNYINTELPYDPIILLLDIYPEKILNLKRYMHPYVHSSTIYNSQDMEAS